jgi:hypothetical protein
MVLKFREGNFDMRTYLNAREWLEAQRLAGCEWAPELLDLLDEQNERDAEREALESIDYALNGPHPAYNRRELNPEAIEREACRRLNLLESLEEIISDHLADMEWPNGKEPVNLDDKLRAAFESGHWLTYDL